MARAKAKSFEQQLAELEATVGRLERDELSLDESLKLYAEGVELARACRDKLTAAEQVLNAATADPSDLAATADISTADTSATPSTEVK